jgi:methyltransferase OMS1
MSGTGFFLSVSWTYFSYRRALTTPLPTADEVRDVEAAMLSLWRARDPRTFDSALEWSEWAMGVSRRRRELIGGAPGGNWAARLLRRWRGEPDAEGEDDGWRAGAVGDVLESAAGTGRNLKAYMAAGARVRSVTLVDASAGLLEAARERWQKEETRRADEAKSGYFKGNRRGMPPARFLTGDMAAEETLRQLLRGGGGGGGGGGDDDSAPDEGAFDTVVQTMGLCSTRDPARLLDNLGRAVKPGGRVLLLEHGRGWEAWLNDLLDHTAAGHARGQGCWWNRDVGSIVEGSGLVVESCRRSNLGTTWCVVLRRPVGWTGRARVERREAVKAVVEKEEEERKPVVRWWEVWK